MSYKKIKFPAKSKSLITDGIGFIGSNLCETLLSIKFHVKYLDDFYTLYRKKESREGNLLPPYALTKKQRKNM